MSTVYRMCPQCDCLSPDSANFCAQCGFRYAPLEDDAESDNEPSQDSIFDTRPPPSDRPLPAQRVLALAAAVVFGIVAVWTVLWLRAPEAPGPPLPITLPRSRDSASPGQQYPQAIRPSPVIPQQVNAPAWVMPTQSPRPVDVIDYLRFFKDVEIRRVGLTKAHIAHMLEVTAVQPGGNIEAFLKTDEDHITRRRNQTDSTMHIRAAGVQQEWNRVSNYFLSRQPPQSCAKLRDLYYDALGKTAGYIVQAYNTFSQSPSNSLGSSSASIERACRAADEELASVCNTFRITKDFDIIPDGGGSPLLGGMGMGL